MSLPLVSIGVPTYNRASFLRWSLETICRQDYSPIEILISDNCSDDETESLCRDLERADARVRYIRHPRNIGLFSNHNFCIEESRGEFLCLFNDDDLYGPTIVSRYAAFLRAHPEVGIVCSDWELIDEKGMRLGVREHAVPSLAPGLEYIGRTIRSGQSTINTPGAMIRKAALGHVRFAEKEQSADFVLWFQIAERAAVGHIRECLWRYRLHRGSGSRRTIHSIPQHYREHLGEYFQAHLGHWPEHAAIVDRWRRDLNRYLFWALAYEVGLHHREKVGRTSKAGHYRTVFEIANYHLSREEIAEVLGQLKALQRGLGQRASLLAIQALLRLNLTRSLGWVTSFVPLIRTLLGLR